MTFPTPSEIHNRSKRLGIQTRAADQRSVNFDLSHQSLDIVGFDAATVEDSRPGSAFGTKTCRCLLPQEPVRISRHFRSRRAARANRPYRFVSKDDTRELGSGQRGRAAAELAFEDFLGPAAFALGQCLAHAQYGS